MLNNLMDMINGLKERDLMDGITANDINELGFVLIRNNFILSMYGMAIGGLFIANEEMVGKPNIPMIIVDDVFYEFSKNSRSFIIAHELGHRQHEVQTEGYVRKINDEFEADEYSAKLVGIDNAIKALNDIKQTLMKKYFMEATDEGIKEIDIRIENLINKFMVTC